jgi:hypothetical protein
MGMTPPEKSRTPNAPELRPNQVPWGAPKTAAKAAKPEPAPPAPKKLSANRVPWGSRKPAASPAPPPTDPDSIVTHMPWADPARPPIPQPAPPTEPVVSAKKIPWSWRKKPKPEESLTKKAPAASKPLKSAWAMPKPGGNGIRARSPART